jgi:autoinducer 2 (AI-2) kinase
LFPEVVEAGTVAGRVSGDAVSETGLAPGTPVVAGGLDTALGVAGPGRPVPGQLTVTGGSFWKQTVVAGAAFIEPAGRLRTICHLRPGQWLVEGISFYAGFALRWLRDTAAARWPAGRPPGYAELEELAAAVPPGAGGTARLAPADAWTWARWQPPFRDGPRDGPPAGLGEQARAVQEAAAYSTRRAAGLISELLGPGAGQEVILTGGAARSTLWPQVLADVLGRPVSVPDHSETAALGAAILAGRAAGVLPDDPPAAGPPDEAGWTAPARSARPGLAQQRAYEVLYARWRRSGAGDHDAAG